jgi:tRNA(His) 5'-end guanylyltransferase
MSASTLDYVLTSAEALSAEEQAMLEELLRRRRIESWRAETAADAAWSAKALRAGKLKPQSAGNVITRLRAAR